MSAVLLSLHVVLTILAIGPIAVAASIFPRYVRAAAGQDESAVPVVAALHRICRTSAIVGVAVPLPGILTALSMAVLAQARVLVSNALTAVAAAPLVAGILPAQRAVLDGAAVRRDYLDMATIADPVQ